MASFLNRAFLLFSFVLGADGYLCSRRAYSYFYTYTKFIYCSTGCCGSYYNRYCCMGGGLISGIVFACLAGISIIVVVVCMCIKKQGYRGRVVGPVTRQHQENVTVAYTGGQKIQYPLYLGYQQPQQPPPYLSNDLPPPYGHASSMDPPPGAATYNSSTMNRGLHPPPVVAMPQPYPAPPVAPNIPLNTTPLPATAPPPFSEVASTNSLSSDVHLSKVLKK